MLPIPLRAAILAGSFVEVVREVPGADTVAFLLSRFVGRFDEAVTATYGPGLQITLRPKTDGRPGILFRRWRQPVLGPILEAALSPGDTFADVGANRGIYAMWGARLVGPEGRVHAFEPHPTALAELRGSLRANGLGNVEVVAAATGSENRSLRLWCPSGNSALTSRDLGNRAEGDWIDAKAVRLDHFYRDRSRPSLIKIDVEGMELDVLRGTSGLLLSDTPPVVVFEAGFAADYPLIQALLQDAGFELYALTPRGLRPEPPDAVRPGSFNVLAVKLTDAFHARVVETLRRVRFPACQHI